VNSRVRKPESKKKEFSIVFISVGLSLSPVADFFFASEPGTLPVNLSVFKRYRLSLQKFVRNK
jgi:hypothetical protein